MVGAEVRRCLLCLEDETGSDRGHQGGAGRVVFAVDHERPARDLDVLLRVGVPDVIDAGLEDTNPDSHAIRASIRQGLDATLKVRTMDGRHDRLL